VAPGAIKNITTEDTEDTKENNHRATETQSRSTFDGRRVATRAVGVGPMHKPSTTENGLCIGPIRRRKPAC
jgi:hypothetical protein